MNLVQGKHKVSTTWKNMSLYNPQLLRIA